MRNNNYSRPINALRSSTERTTSRPLPSPCACSVVKKCQACCFALFVSASLIKQSSEETPSCWRPTAQRAFHHRQMRQVGGAAGKRCISSSVLRFEGTPRKPRTLITCNPPANHATGACHTYDAVCSNMECNSHGDPRASASDESGDTTVWGGVNDRQHCRTHCRGPRTWSRTHPGRL